MTLDATQSNPATRDVANWPDRPAVEDQSQTTCYDEAAETFEKACDEAGLNVLRISLEITRLEQDRQKIGAAIRRARKREKQYRERLLQLQEAGPEQLPLFDGQTPAEAAVDIETIEVNDG